MLPELDRAEFDLYDRHYFESERDNASVSSSQIVPIVFELVRPKSVVDVGCGTGAWLARFREFGAKEILGIDGSWVEKDMLLIPKSQFLELDLSQPIEIGRKFDLVVSLEVAEHLPNGSAEAFVTSLTSLGPVILFSAAIPQQGGTNHLNEQWPEYWSNLFRSKGYELVDCIRKRIWQDVRISYFYRQNIMMFIEREELNDFPALRIESKANSPLNLVHPELWSGYVSTMQAALSPRNIPARLVIRSVPYVVAKIARYPLRKLSSKRK